MPLIKKPWGHKITIMETDHVIVDHLFIKPGGYSSVHSHKLLRNCFYVLKDWNLDIQVFEVENIDVTTRISKQPGFIQQVNPVDHITVSRENNGVVIPPKIVHRFRNPHDCTIEVIEVSYLSAISIEDDIFRVAGYNVGGFSE